MRSMFATAHFQKFDLGRHLLIGQSSSDYLTQAERDQILSEISGAMTKVRPIEDLMAWSGEFDPGLVKYLGGDANRFLTITDTIAPLYPTVENLQLRLSGDPGEGWYRPLSKEAADYKQWVSGITEMYKILEKAKASKSPSDPIIKSLPNSVKNPTSVATPTDQKVLLGLSSKELLIGGGIALGAGVLISLLS